MDPFETSLGYRSAVLALIPQEQYVLKQLSEQELFQLASDTLDASLAEMLRTGVWHWKLDMHDLVEQIASTLCTEEKGTGEHLRTALWEHYKKTYRRPSAQEYRNYLREKRVSQVQESASFEVTYIAHSMYTTEITAVSLEALWEKVEATYDATDLDRFAFDSHDVAPLKPLNARAKCLLDEDAKERAKQQEIPGVQSDSDVNEPTSTLFAQVFTIIWSDSELRRILLANVEHELGRESSRSDIADIVLTVLEHDVSALRAVKLREELPIAPLVEFLIAYVGKVPLAAEYLAQNGVDPQLLEPKVTAYCHSDDYVVEVERFDATLFFAQASDDDLAALRAEGYGGGYAADRVAEVMADFDPDIQAMFNHNTTLPDSVELRGFECHVDEDEAEAWMAKHRPHLLTESHE